MTTTSSVGKNHNNHFLHSGDTGSSGAESDVKLEIRTSSSMSEQRDWVDVSNNLNNERNAVTANEIAQVVENIYNYTQHQVQEPVYSSNNKTVSVSLQ
jgi:hypothetical protein